MKVTQTKIKRNSVLFSGNISVYDLFYKYLNNDTTLPDYLFIGADCIKSHGSSNLTVRRKEKQNKKGGWYGRCIKCEKEAEQRRDRKKHNYQKNISNHIKMSEIEGAHDFDDPFLI